MSYYAHPFFTQSHPHAHRRAAAAAPTPSYHPFGGSYPAGPRHPRHAHFDVDEYDFPSAPPFGHGIRHPYHVPTVPTPPPVPAPAPAPVASDLEEEERAALAYLRSIQRRREHAQAQAQAQAAIEAEVAAKAKAQAEAEARAAYEAELVVRARAKAQLKAEAKAQKEAAIRHAIEKQIEAERRVAAARAEQERERQIAYAHVRQGQEERRRQYLAAVQQHRAAKLEEIKQNACARFGQRSAQAAQAEQRRFDRTQLNGILGTLFGINIVNENESTQPQEQAAPAPAQTTTSAEKTAELPAHSTAKEQQQEAENQGIPKEINDLLSHFLGLRVEPISENDKVNVDKEIEKTTKSIPNAVPAGLNEFLSRFGLEFEPIDVAQAGEAAGLTAKAEENQVEKQKATQDAPAPATAAPAVTAQATPASSSTAEAKSTPTAKAPFTNFFGQHANLPPFLHDIFSNIEESIIEEVKERSRRDFGGVQEKEVEGKGKGVAEGEKKTSTSAPATEKPTSITAPAAAEPTQQDIQLKSAKALDKVESDLDALKRFSFPTKLSFSPSPASTPVNEPSDEASQSSSPAPPLLFNRQNSPYHHQANSLLQLLLALDNIPSAGDKNLRKRRKELVKRVEGEIEGLERRRDLIWEEVRVQREVGLADEIDEGHASDSETSSDAGKSHDFEDVSVEVSEDQSKADQATSTATAPVATTEHDSVEEEVKGYEIPDPTTTEAALAQPVEHQVEQEVSKSGDDQVVFDAEESEKKDETVDEKVVEKSDPKEAEKEHEEGFELI